MFITSKPSDENYFTLSSVCVPKFFKGHFSTLCVPTMREEKFVIFSCDLWELFCDDNQDALTLYLYIHTYIVYVDLHNILLIHI